MISAAEVEALNLRFEKAPTEEILGWAWREFGARAAIGTSFQGAGLVIIDLCKKNNFAFPVFTLDTGYLFPETIALKERLEKFFGIPIQSMVPDLSIEQQNQVHGENLWQRDPDLCCTVRKVLPLQSKLGQLDCWITGLRRQQSETRAHIQFVESYLFDAASNRDIIKLNPVADWSRDAVWDYLKKEKVPYNPLHDQGYRSIGCQPCTRQTSNGDNERAGRWTGFNKSECGIHTFLQKKG